MFIITNTNNYFAKMDNNLNQMLQLLGDMFVINNELDPNLLRNHNVRGDIRQDLEVMGRMFAINNNMSLHRVQLQNEITEIVNSDMPVPEEQNQQDPSGYTPTSEEQAPGEYKSASEIQYGEMPDLENQYGEIPDLVDLEDSYDEMPALEDPDDEMPPLEDADDEMPALE